MASFFLSLESRLFSFKSEMLFSAASSKSQVNCHSLILQKKISPPQPWKNKEEKNKLCQSGWLLSLIKYFQMIEKLIF